MAAGLGASSRLLATAVPAGPSEPKGFAVFSSPSLLFMPKRIDLADESWYELGSDEEPVVSTTVPNLFSHADGVYVGMGDIAVAAVTPAEARMMYHKIIDDMAGLLLLHSADKVGSLLPEATISRQADIMRMLRPQQRLVFVSYQGYLVGLNMADDGYSRFVRPFTYSQFSWGARKPPLHILVGHEGLGVLDARRVIAGKIRP